LQGAEGLTVTADAVTFSSQPRDEESEMKGIKV